MLVLSEDSGYSFASMTVKVTDNTIARDENLTPVPPVPKFNVLIPTVQAVGSTNVMELFYPGEKNRYIQTHGRPDPSKFGFGPDFIAGILDESREAADVGVYTVNLRGASATVANNMVYLKYKVEEDVPYVDQAGDPYYVDVNGQLTTTPTDATPVVRDVLHVKYGTAHLEDCKKWVDLHKAMNQLFSDEVDDEGYKTMPLFAVMYRGASTFGNNVFFNMVPKTAEYDGNVYYALTVFDGVNTTTTDSNYSMYNRSGEKYNTSYFIETMFNSAFPTLRMLTAETIEQVYELFNKYLYTVDDVIAGRAPSKSFENVDMFSCNEFGVVIDEGSLNTQITNCFTLQSGFDGTETPDELLQAFFKGEIIGDIASVLRYRITYIPDTGYDVDTKYAIRDLVAKRNRMTSATVMLGGEDSFASALIDHQANWYDTMPNIRQLAKVQSPMMYNEYIRRTITYPATYFDTMALIDHFVRWGHKFMPFAGADARWTGFIEDTMPYAAETADTINSFYTNRINLVMKDADAGAYLSDQQMNTLLASDQTELNNAFLISSMLYDLLQLIHRNHFKFNEPEDVKKFGQSVDECVNQQYAAYSASLACEVYRMGTIGRAKSTNKVKVTINMKDINKKTDVDIILTDE